jgi:acyl-coenzyme A thioesterase PaaI-like protein
MADPIPPDSKRERNRCFVCGEDNLRGLHVEFAASAGGKATAAWRAPEECEGFPGIVHGGIVATLLDEAMAKAVAATGSHAFTCELRIRLRRHVRTEEMLEISGCVTARHKRKLEAEASIRDATGQELAHAWAAFLEPVREPSS